MSVVLLTIAIGLAYMAGGIDEWSSTNADLTERIRSRFRWAAAGAMIVSAGLGLLAVTL